MRILKSLIFVFFLPGQFVNAQLPVTHLYLFLMDQDTSGSFHIYAPQFLSAFNPDGYNNQPSFVSEEEVFASIRLPGQDQNEIYAFNISSQQYRQVTNTSESEYSPKRIPGQTNFSCVRQVPGERINQQLIIFPLDQSTSGRSTFSQLKNVGYYQWLDDKNVGLFLVDDISKLAIGNAIKDQYTLQASNVGRGFDLSPAGKLVYVHKYTDDYWYLKSLNIDHRQSDILIETQGKTEDFCIASDGTIFMGQGSILYQFHPQEDKSWKPVYDLAVFGIQNITRMAINSSNHLILVDKRN